MNVLSLMVTADHPVPVEPNGGTATVTVNSGGPLYYADTPQVSPSNNQGSISAGSSQQLTSQTWLIASSPAAVQVQFNALTAASSYLVPSGGDDSPAMVRALTSFAPFAYPIVQLGTGTFQWGSQIPSFARSMPAKVIGAGADKTVIKLSAAAPRAFDFNKIADYDTFSQIELSDFTVDANNVGGRHHVIIGTWINNSVLSKINITNLSVRRVKTINVLTDPTDVNQRHNIYIIVKVNQADNPCSFTNLLFEDLDLQGGQIGVSVGGTTDDGSGNGNLTHDRIYCTRVRHDSGIPLGGLTTVSGAGQTISTTPSTLTVGSTSSPTAFASTGRLSVAGVTGVVTYTGKTATTFTGCTVASGSFTATNGGTVAPSTYGGENIQIGSKDTGLTVVIRDCYGANSGDVGIAVLNCRNGLVDGCVVQDAHNGAFQAANFNQVMPADQRKVFRSCEARLVNLSPSSDTTPSAGFYFAGSPNQPLYQVALDNCKWVSTAATVGQGSAIYVNNPISRLTLNNFQINALNINYSISANQTPAAIFLQPSSGTPFTIEGTLRSNVGGTITLNANTCPWRDVWFFGSSGCDTTFDITSHYFNNSLAGVATNSVYIVDVNPTQVLATRPTVRGNYRYVVESYGGADTGPTGANVARYGTSTSPGASQQLIIDGFLIFQDCDAGRFPSGSIGREIVVNGIQTLNSQGTPDGSFSGNVPLVWYPRYRRATSNAAASSSTAIPHAPASQFGLTSGSLVLNQTGIAQMMYTDAVVTALTIQRRSDGTARTIGTMSGGPWLLEPGDGVTITTATGTPHYWLQPVFI